MSVKKPGQEPNTGRSELAPGGVPTMDSRAPRSVSKRAVSLTTIASKGGTWSAVRPVWRSLHFRYHPQGSPL